MLPHDFPPYKGGVLLLSTLAETRHLGADESTATPTITPTMRSNPSSKRRHCGQPVGKNDGKKGASSLGGLADLKHLAWEVYGFDGGKLVKGRKRHIMVDTQGLLMSVVVTEANAPERIGAVVALLEDNNCCQQLQLIWADSGYRGANFTQSVMLVCNAKVEIVKRTKLEFEVLLIRWVVERTFAWLGRYRRLSKDYELLPEVSESMIYIAMVRLMLKRLAVFNLFFINHL